MEKGIPGISKLAEVGVGLLPQENVEVFTELEGSLVEVLSRRRPALLLTDRRLIRFTEGEHRVDAISVRVEDIDSIEVRRTSRDRQWVGVGLVFVAGGALLGSLSMLLLTSPISPLLMAVALTLIGIVFLLTYVGGATGQVTAKAGAKEIRCKVSPRTPDASARIARRVTELKLGLEEDGTGGKLEGSPTVNDKDARETTPSQVV